jgi:hypothetical protein
MKNGNLRVQCPTVQSECLQKAEIHCADQGGVLVLSSREKDELYGVEGHKEGTLMSEVVFVCGDDAPRKPIKLPPKEEAAPAPSAQPPAKRICVPGSTQRCVGPGACVGGQSCLSSGTGWAVCKCGPPPATDRPTEAGDPAAATDHPDAGGTDADPAVTAPEAPAHPDDAHPDPAHRDDSTGATP